MIVTPNHDGDSDPNHDAPLFTVGQTPQEPTVRPTPLDCGTGHPVVAPGLATARQNPASMPRGRVQAYVAFTTGDKRVTVGVDTWCEVSVIDPSVVDPSWERVPLEDLDVFGIGGLVPDHFEGAAIVPLRHRWMAPVRHYIMAIGPTPPGTAKCLMGKWDQNDLGMVYVSSMGCDRVVYTALQLVIELDDVDAVNERLARLPYSVAALCSGCNLAVCAFLDLGYTIRRWVSVESSQVCRDVSSRILPTIEHYTSHDVLSVGADFLQSKFDLSINSPPCQPFSGCNPAAKGWDDPRSMPMKQGAAINDELRIANPSLQIFVEQVRPAQHLHNVLADWDRLYHGQFQLCHADHWGAACTRPRMLNLSKSSGPVDLSAILRRPPVDINSLLEPGWRSPTPVDINESLI